MTLAAAPAVAHPVDRRARIIDATLRLVAAGGWRGVTVAAVADAAAIATGTVYRHVTGKDALFAAAFRHAAARELARVLAETERPGAARQRLEAAMRVFACRALRGGRLAYALLAESAGPAVELERRAYRQGYRDLFRGIVADGIAGDEFASCDPAVVAAVVTGALEAGLVDPLAPAACAGPDARAAVVEELVACCLRVLPPAPSESARCHVPAPADPPRPAAPASGGER